MPNRRRSRSETDSDCGIKLLVFVVFCILLHKFFSDESSSGVIWLNAKNRTYSSPAVTSAEMKIFCYSEFSSSTKSEDFLTPELSIHLASDNFEIYEGDDKYKVWANSNSTTRLDPDNYEIEVKGSEIHVSLKLWKNCIGIRTRTRYNLELNFVKDHTYARKLFVTLIAYIIFTFILLVIVYKILRKIFSTLLFPFKIMIWFSKVISFIGCFLVGHPLLCFSVTLSFLLYGIINTLFFI